MTDQRPARCDSPSVGRAAPTPNATVPPIQANRDLLARIEFLAARDRDSAVILLAELDRCLLEDAAMLAVDR